MAVPLVSCRWNSSPLHVVLPLQKTRSKPRGNLFRSTHRETNGSDGANGDSEVPDADTMLSPCPRIIQDVSISRRGAFTSLGTAAFGTFFYPSLGTFPSDYLAVAQAAQYPPEVQEWSLFDGGTTLTVRSDGSMTMKKGESSQNLAISLPADAIAGGATSVPATGSTEGAILVLKWSGTCQLVIWPATLEHNSAVHAKFSSWSGGVNEGFFLELSLPAVTHTGTDGVAAINIDLSSGGRWYGGAHMLRQLWPIDRAQFEVGPYYPFDHGPNGLGSVVGAHWVSSAGTLIAVDPRTPLLHVGLNAPSTLRPSNDPRYFGVGIQHLTQQALPMEDNLQSGKRDGSHGDGLLRIQARASWDDLGTLHPWQNVATPGLATEQRKKFSRNLFNETTMITSQELSVRDEDLCVLRVMVAATSDVRTATISALKPLPKPRQAPPAVVLERPTWTTWATSHADVTQEDTLALGEAVLEHGFRPGVLEIDDRWQSRYGDLVFDEEKFPDPKVMVDKLHEQGFLVTVWVMPFLQEGSTACSEARSLGYVIEGGDPPSISREITTGGSGERLGSTVKVLVDKFDWPPGHWQGGGGSFTLLSGQFRWWGTQPVRAIDLTNDDAVEWFLTRLKVLQQEVGLDGFKFDAGEPCFLPQGALTHRPLSYPGEYTQLWIEKVVSKFEISEVRSAMATTGYGGLIRMGDRDTVWGADNGLRSLIPTLLTSAVLGYPFCLPDMVGGNAYWGQFPDTELMVRWAQASVLMPAVQWSIPPWEVSDQALEACKTADRMREQILLPRITTLAEDAVAQLTPICKPLWWLDPTDKETYNVDDQFAIGDDVIVAPVVEKGAVRRRVYLPSGRWVEWNSSRDFYIPGGRIHQLADEVSGPCWIEVDAPLEKLPVFVKVGG